MKIIRTEHVVEGNGVRLKRVCHVDENKIEWLEPSSGARGMPDWIPLNEDTSQLEDAFLPVLSDFEIAQGVSRP